MARLVKRMNNKLVIGIVALCLIIAGGYLYVTSQPTVASQGYATVEAVPDKVSVYFVLESHNASQQASQEHTILLRNDLVRALVAKGFSEEEIQFSGFSSYPEYDWSSGQQKLLGYVTREDVTLSIDSFDRVSNAVSAGISAGAYVSSINLELSTEKQNEYKIQALEDASKDARTKAAAQAAGLGRSLGGLVSVQSQDYQYYPAPYYQRADFSVGSDVKEEAAAQDAALSVSPRPLDVTASVQVVYRLSL